MYLCYLCAFQFVVLKESALYGDEYPCHCTTTSSAWINIGSDKALHRGFSNSLKVPRLPDPVPVTPRSDPVPMTPRSEPVPMTPRLDPVPMTPRSDPVPVTPRSDPVPVIDPLDLFNPESVGFDTVSRTTTLPSFKSLRSGLFVLSY